ncbi:4-amino-4-deoxy-L-arabinose transferase [Aeromicrobium sp. UC242_57]|uniref:4-amino-4-deoxy-L-arabinose transferase n=1 Tax=Aeromicrobium sp. UC242_57 TaxID=3374624 RepID=UPI0037B0B1D2
MGRLGHDVVAAGDDAGSPGADRRPIGLRQVDPGRRVVALASDHGTPVRCVHLEDIYPGWDGLDAAAGIVVTDILRPLHAGDRATWQTYDWHATAPGPLLHADAGSALIVEGTGALTRAGAALATFTIWVEADEEFRQSRAFARDGDIYRPHWQRWADQEDEAAGPGGLAQLADIIIDATTVKEAP